MDPNLERVSASVRFAIDNEIKVDSNYSENKS